MNTTFDTLATTDALANTQRALEQNGFHTEVVPTGAEALARIKALIPKGASVDNGSSVTLAEIGYVDFLATGTHGWNDLHAPIVVETDPAKQAALRRQAALSDWYVGSVHAVSETGELVIASNTGSQLPHLVFTSPNIILVVSTKKITPTLVDALRRLEEHVVPLEDARIMAARNVHTTLAKTLILHKENPKLGRNVTVILVQENLGF
jgi:hypothetical protein